MISIFISAIIAPLALQAAPLAAQAAPSDAAPEAITSLSQLPIEEAATARCGVAFAVVGRWQRDADPRAAGYPDMETGGGKEFFVRTMAGLMDGRELDRDDVARLIVREVSILDSAEGADQVAAMMPACLLMKRSAGL